MSLRLKNPSPSRAAYSIDPNPAPTNPAHITITMKPAMLCALSTLLHNAHYSGADLSPLMLRFMHDSRRIANSFLTPTPDPVPQPVVVSAPAPILSLVSSPAD